MKSHKRCDKQPLLEHQRYNKVKAFGTTTLTEPTQKPCHWKFWISIVSIALATAFILVSVLMNNEISFLNKNNNKSTTSTSSSSEIEIEVTSYLSDERIAAVNADSGLTAAAKFDLITYLPGLVVDINDLNFHMFSGYIESNYNEGDTVDKNITKQLFYWFFTADTNNSDEQPLMLWTNGGPGCSGMDGLMTEHGPLLVNDNLEMYVNNYAWNKVVNMIYIEQPYGVGFSSPAKGQTVAGDVNAAIDMVSFMHNFIKKFPKYSNNDLYLSSESWGGHYIPMTAFQTLHTNRLGNSVQLNLKGFLLGNPYTEYYENWIGFMEALYGHGLMKQTTYETWRGECYENLPDLENAVCTLNYIEAFVDALGVDWYALDFPDCEILEKGSSLSKKYNLMNKIHGRRAIKLYEQFKNDATFNALIDEKERISKKTIETQLSRVRGASDSIAYYACVDDYMASYLNTDSVQEALHAKLETNWAMCSDDVYYAWTDNDWINGMQTVYHTILNEYSDTPIDMVLYSGDDDSVCGTAGTQYWLRNMGWDVDESTDWKEWRYENELAGFYTKFVHPSGNVALWLQTVRSAGHMVPQTQPKRSLELLNRFVNGFYS